MCHNPDYLIGIGDMTRCFITAFLTVPYRAQMNEGAKRYIIGCNKKLGRIKMTEIRANVASWVEWRSWVDSGDLRSNSHLAMTTHQRYNGKTIPWIFRTP